MRYLILGSAGVIGKALCQFLRMQGHEVLTFDIQDDPIEDLRVAYNPILYDKLTSCDFVFFLAWDVGGSLYLQKHQESFNFIQNNLRIITSTFDMLRVAKKPFIFASSQMSNMTYSTYGMTKHIGEKLTSALNGVTVKFWNVYGYEHDLNKSHVVTDFILKAKNTGVIDMHTDGSESRQMLYDTDCSKCLYRLSQLYTELDRSKNYHITSFEWVSIYEIAEIIAEYYKGATIVSGNKVDIQKDLRNEPDNYILNHWKPEISLREGILDMINKIELHC